MFEVVEGSVNCFYRSCGDKECESLTIPCVQYALTPHIFYGCMELRHPDRLLELAEFVRNDFTYPPGADHVCKK